MHDHHLINAEQRQRYREIRAFVAEHVQPFDQQWDKQQAVPLEVIKQCYEAGYVGGIIPKEYGGGGWSTVDFGLLNEAFGAASSSLCGLFTVQTMVAMTLVKWGNTDQQHRWLPAMAKGDILAAFAMTEPKVGSNIQAMETAFTLNGGTYLLNGTKKWITYSGLADIFLVFGKCDQVGGDGSIAAVVRADAPGVQVPPIREMLGFRGVYLSQIDFKDCEVKVEDIVGKPGFVFSYIAPYGLHYGRMSTAWSAVGLMRACLETCAHFASQRRAFNETIGQLGMIRRLLTEMGVHMEAARLLCLSAAMADDQHLPAAMEKTLEAKYYSSQAAVKAAADTVQVLGARGCSDEEPAARFYRNAKVMEIIEGTTQVIENVLGKSILRKHAKKQ